MDMKGHSLISKTIALEPNYQMVKCHVHDTYYRDTVGVFNIPI